MQKGRGETSGFFVCAQKTEGCIYADGNASGQKSKRCTSPAKAGAQMERSQ